MVRSPSVNVCCRYIAGCALPVTTVFQKRSRQKSHSVASCFTYVLSAVCSSELLFALAHQRRLLSADHCQSAQLECAPGSVTVRFDFVQSSSVSVLSAQCSSCASAVLHGQEAQTCRSLALGSVCGFAACLPLDSASQLLSVNTPFCPHWQLQ